MSTNPTAQNTNRVGGGILNNGGSVTLTNVTVKSCQAPGKGDSVINDHTTLDALGGGLASLGATGGHGGDAFGTTCLGAHNAGDNWEERTRSTVTLDCAAASS